MVVPLVSLSTQRCSLKSEIKSPATPARPQTLGAFWPSGGLQSFVGGASSVSASALRRASVARHAEVNKVEQGRGTHGGGGGGLASYESMIDGMHVKI